MSHSEDRHLDFVLRHYKEGAFDTRKAIGRFMDAKGIRPTPRRRWNFAAVGVSVAAAVILGVFLFTGIESRRWTQVAAASSQQTVVLPDGTDVTLSPGSSLSYKMKDRREVRMEGKAFFDVTRDEARPFEVDADGAFVRVLGTEFMVDVSDEDAAKVYVQDGKVLFARNEKAEGVVLTKGMSATLAAEADVPVMDEKPDANSIAWQRGTFIFDHTPLKDVLDCLSGYYHVSFAATDLSKELSGEFAADDLELIIELIESALDVTIIRR